MQDDLRSSYGIRSVHSEPSDIMTRTFIPSSFLILATCLIVTSPSWGQTELFEVELARHIVDRTPISPYTPIVYCEKDKNRDAPLPVINTTSDHQVVFWNRVTSATPQIFHHTWHKKTSDGWEPMAHIRLKVQKSSSFRIWSTKEIHPKLHLGVWMIVVSLDSAPKEVLCIARFIVEQSVNTNSPSSKQ